MPGQYSIQVWSFPIAVTGGTASHRFLRLVNEFGDTVKELHGGARGPNDTFQTTAPYGTLFVKEGDPNLRQPNGNELPYKDNPVASTGSQAVAYGSRYEETVARGTKTEMEQGWAAANFAKEAINDKNLTYIPVPTGAIDDSNSNGSNGALIKSASNVTYQNDPAYWGTPGSVAEPLNAAEINAARAAAGSPARTGVEDTILAGAQVFDPEFGVLTVTNTRINGATGDVQWTEARAHTIIDPLTGQQLFNPYGELVKWETYEDNSATPGNPLQTRLLYDPLDQRADVQTREDYGPDGLLVGISKLYDDFTSWLSSRSLNDAHLARMDESAVNALTHEVGRSAFHGGATDSAVPSVLSIEPQFGPAFDFSAGGYDIDVGGAYNSTLPYVNIENASSGGDDTWLGWDNSGYGTSYYTGGWTSSIFDGWDFDWFEPLVLDLNNDGVDITSRIDSTVYFDVDGDGFKEQTAWAGPTDGLLVIDLAANGNAGADGVISQAKEVSFAVQTANPDDTDVQAIRTLYDSNNDGKLTAADTRWGEFRVWKDANQDGVSTASELSTLTALGITEFNLTTDNRALQLPDGSKVHGFGSFTQSGAVRVYGDAAFAYETVGYSRSPLGDGFKYTSENGNLVQSFIDMAVLSQNYPNSNAASYFIHGVDLQINAGTHTSDGAITGNANDVITNLGPYAVTLFGNGGNDILRGNSKNDVLAGGAGTDDLYGLAGDDTLFFDSEDKPATGTFGYLIDGGEGYDTAIFQSTGNLVLVLADKNVEALISGGGNDAITAGSLHLGPSSASPGNTAIGAFIDGRAGNDSIIGSMNDDVLVGGLGADTLIGGSGGDLLQGGAGNDSLDGQDGDDALWSGDGADVLIGGSGADVLHGGQGADSLWGYDGNDTISGDDDDDIISGGANDDSLESGLGQDWLYGEGGADTLRATDNVSNAFNVLVGGEGNDTLIGGPTGFDYFYGGDGTTGGGNDTFIVTANSGIKVMNDFEVSGVNDVVRLEGTALNSFVQVQSNLIFSSIINGTVLIVDGNTQVWFIGHQPNQFSSADFAFA